MWSIDCSIGLSPDAAQPDLRILGIMNSSGPGGLTFNAAVTVAAMTLVALVLPIFFVTANVRHIANSDWVYSYNWWRNGIPERSGITTSELDRAGGQFIDYFNNDEEFLDLRVVLNGAEVSLYNQREVHHMVDVKGLIAGTMNVSLWTGAFLLVAGVAGAVLLGHQFWGLLYRAAAWSALGSLLLIGILFVAVLINFNLVFTTFHFISFANDLWMLDPRNDYLLIMFPQRFFFEATLAIAVMTAIEFAGLVVGAKLLRNRYGEEA